MEREIPTVPINDCHKMPVIMLGSYQITDGAILEQILSASMDIGLYGFDTSPSYGNLSSFGTALHYAMEKTGVSRKQLFISGKIDGWQMCRTNGDVTEYVHKALTELRIEYYDLLLIHWPFRNYLVNTWKTLEALYRDGKVKSIGICNVNERILREYLPEFAILPQVIQNEISPLRTACSEVEYIQSLGIQIQAYSPLCRMLPDIRNSAILGKLAEKYDKSIAQIILRWHIQRGIVPIFTSSKCERIADNTDVFDFTLEPCEVEEINLLDQNYKIFPESFGCPGF